MVYLAVLPSYRQACIDVLLDTLGTDVELFASAHHLDPTVRTGIRADQYAEVRLVSVLGRFFVQLGGWQPAVAAQTTIVDLNPRSLTAWAVLLTRRAFRRRTLVWGHLHPRAGEGSRSAGLRRFMRTLASGTITYTFDQQSSARRELPDQPTWVAPNSLYRRADLAVRPSVVERDAVVYVGRLEPEKKVAMLVDGFRRHAQTTLETSLLIVGAGSETSTITDEIARHGLADRVGMLGPVNDVAELRELYARSFASLSPGFLGLGLTQSLGFGVPQIVSRDEPHSPEIELADIESVSWFETDDADSMASAITDAYARRDSLPLRQAIDRVTDMYSADAMAAGLIAALRGSEGQETSVER